MQLLDHVSISVPDIDLARPFYDAIMAALGAARSMTGRPRSATANAAVRTTPHRRFWRSIWIPLKSARASGTGVPRAASRWRRFSKPAWRRAGSPTAARLAAAVPRRLLRRSSSTRPAIGSRRCVMRPYRRAHRDEVAVASTLACACDSAVNAARRPDSVRRRAERSPPASLNRSSSTPSRPSPRRASRRPRPVRASCRASGSPSLRPCRPRIRDGARGSARSTPAAARSARA